MYVLCIHASIWSCIYAMGNVHVCTYVSTQVLCLMYVLLRHPLCKTHTCRKDIVCILKEELNVYTSKCH